MSIPNDDLLGVIYPLPKEMIERLLRMDNAVFVKFLPREPTRKTTLRLKSGVFLYVYQSSAGKKIVAQAKVSKLEFLYAKEVLQKYSGLLCISRKELQGYSNGREDKRLLVLHLEQIHKLDRPIQLRKPLTMAGIYVTEQNKGELFLA